MSSDFKINSNFCRQSFSFELWQPLKILRWFEYLKISNETIYRLFDQLIIFIQFIVFFDVEYFPRKLLINESIWCKCNEKMNELAMCNKYWTKIIHYLFFTAVASLKTFSRSLKLFENQEEATIFCLGLVQAIYRKVEKKNLKVFNCWSRFLLKLWIKAR